MKLLKQISLAFQSGTLDKVYEIDLCEVTVVEDQPLRFVVNFRYGRRGTTLRDGTKTIAPVTREQAEGIFTRLVSSKLEKGYQYAAGSDVLDGGVTPGPPSGESASQPVVLAEVVDPRVEAVLQRLAQGHQSDSRWSLSRAAWRAGEMQLKRAEPLLLGLLGSGRRKGRSPDQPMLDYCVLAALVHCGSAQSVPAIRKILADKNQAGMVRRMAAEVLLRHLEGAAREELIRNAIEGLPSPLVESARNGPSGVFRQRLGEYLQAGGDVVILDGLYRIDNENVRPALLDVLRSAPLKAPFFQRFRHIFKAAEIRRDGEVFGLLAYRFETLRSAADGEAASTDYGTLPDGPSQGRNARKAFSGKTRHYLRRRVWWTLQRLGELEDESYVRMAIGVLLPFSDQDGGTPYKTTRYVWQESGRGRGFSTVDVHFDVFARCWAFNQVLYANSSRYRASTDRSHFECIPPYKPGDPVPEGREEAFPKLWEAAPQGLLHLLQDSRCEVVHRFALKTLQACAEFCDRLDIQVLLMLLGAPYHVTIEFGLQLAVSRYDPEHPDRELLLVLADCELERAREQAHTWVRAAQVMLLADTGLVVALATSRFADTRGFARSLLRTATLDEPMAHAIIGRLIAKLQSLGSEDGPLAADVEETMLRVFARQLRRIGPEVIRDLLAHPLPEIQRFAGNLVLDHDRLAAHPPEDVLRALLNADDASVREVGVRIIGQLPDDVLKRSIELLFALSRSEHPDVREAIRPVIRRLIATDIAFAVRIAKMFVEALLIPGAPEGVPSYTCRLLREDLRSHLRSVPSEMVFRLLQSRSGPAREVGGLLLATNVQPDELSVEQIVRLAGNDILSVRQAAWQMCGDDVDRLRERPATAARLLDAGWEDARQFGFQFFRDHFTARELTPVVLVSICDSVRPDVQQFGREMITRFFQEEMGQETLLWLSEHPTTAMQMFASNLLDRYATDNPDRLRELTPYFVSVLSRVNRGRVAKDRVLAFLEREATKCETSARIVAEILTRQSATCAIGDKGHAIEVMVKIRAAYPDIPLPLAVQPVEVRGGG